MDTCLKENELAEYADWFLYGGENPESGVLSHVEHCPQCKHEIMEICELMDQVEEAI